MKVAKYNLLILLLLSFGKASAQPLNKLKPGPYKVGFKTILQTNEQGKPVLICLWYPLVQIEFGI